MMMSTTNNSNSFNQFFGNNFVQFSDFQHVAEEKLDQFGDGVPNHSLVTTHQYLHEQHQQQQQLQRQLALQQQQQLCQHQLEQPQPPQQQPFQQTHSTVQSLNNVNVNQGLIPSEISQQVSQNLQGLLNTSSFRYTISSNPFEPSPIVEKPRIMNGSTSNSILPLNFVSNGTATSLSARDPSKSAEDDIPSGINRTKRLLPLGFEPSDKNIICGNKRKYFESKGNIRFRSVCKLFTNDYYSAPTKVEKSTVVSEVMAILREDCPGGGNSLFVTPQGGRWYAVSERTSREKVGTFFRDCLADTYKSSAKNKIAKRKQVKQERSSSGNSSNDGSTTSGRSILKPPAVVASASPSALGTNGHRRYRHNHLQNNANSNEEDDGSMGSMSFYDVNDLTSVSL